MEIQIRGLTKEQVEMLDFMWTLESLEEFEEWKATLDRREQLLADTLQRMVLMASLDEHLEGVTKFPEAKQLLQQFQL
jgi:hypothetical protein